jgi:hypothetical protein
VGRSVVAGLVVRSGVGVVFSVRSSGGMARGVPNAALCGILGVNDTTLLQNGITENKRKGINTKINK